MKICNRFLSQLSCLCGPYPPSLCCLFLPNLKQSLATRCMYTLLLILSTMICCSLQSNIYDNWNFNSASTNNSCVLDFDMSSMGIANCTASVLGYQGVYRVTMAMVTFHVVILITCFKVASSSDIGAGYHNGYWALKLLKITIMLFIALFVSFSHQIFTVWMFVGLIGGFIFIGLQLVLLIDFTRAWNVKWNTYAYRSNTPLIWIMGINLSAVLITAAALAGITSMYYVYGYSPQCRINRAIISLSVVLVICTFLMLVIPITRSDDSNTGLIQPSVVALYIVYLTWIALVSVPLKDYDQKGGDENYSCSAFKNSENTIFTNIMNALPDKTTAYIGAFVMIVMVAHSSVKSSDSYDNLGISNRPHPCDNHETCYFCITDPSNDLGNYRQTIIYDEAEKVVYNYPFFHFVYIMAYLYIMAQVTDWYRPEESKFMQINRNWPSVWVKVASCWTCFMVYAVNLLLPRLLPHRQFPFLDGTLSMKRNIETNQLGLQQADVQNDANDLFISPTTPIEEIEL